MSFQRISIFSSRLTLIAFLMVIAVMRATAIEITGFVRDSVSREPVPFATVAVMGSTIGVVAGEKGGFHIAAPAAVAVLRITAVGYEPRVVSVDNSRSVLVADLVPAANALGEVVVTRGKEKYSKKNNPAVELARRLIEHKHDDDPRRVRPQTSWTAFEQLVFGLNEVGDDAATRTMMKKFDFLNEYALVSQVTGKQVLPIVAKEQFSTHYWRLNPSAHRQVVHASQSEGLDDSFDAASMKRFMDDLLREVDITDGNDVTILTNRFVSPLSSIAISFYKFYLNDTIEVDGERCVDLSFIPFNTESFGFVGHIYVSLADTTRLFIKRVSMGVPRNINLNYVERVSREQTYRRGADGCREPLTDVLEAEFRIIPGTPGLFARRMTTFGAVPPPAIDGVGSPFDLPDEVTVESRAGSQGEAYWQAVRPAEHNDLQTGVKTMVEKLRSRKFFYWAERVVVALARGYVGTSRKNSKVDIGPLNTMLSGNSLEGFRLRAGAVTNANLSKHWFMRGYVAYGFRDKKWKYMGQVEYSFSPKERYETEFPIHSLRLRHSYDVERHGQRYLFTNADNVFLALKRSGDNRIAYLRHTSLEYRRENNHHFSVALTLEHSRHEHSLQVPYVTGDGTVVPYYDQTGARLTLRWAPGEKFFQMRSIRLPINLDAPVFSITHVYMPGNMFGNRREVHATELGAEKRFWLSAFGYVDALLRAGQVWSRVEYPNLMMPAANMSYTIQPESFALMEPMEFIADRYVHLDVTYWLNGWLFNRVPLLKKLKLREVVSARMWWGSLSSKNDPRLNTDLLQLPEGIIGAHDGKPYVEMSVGLDNILTILRVDYVWRLTYRDVPGTSRRGVRIALHFTF